MDDNLAPDSQVHNPKCISYMERHFTQAARAIQAGVPLQGYFVWSLMYNFIWAEGYSKRIGLIYIDYATQKRILTDSAYWYRDWITCQQQVGDCLVCTITGLRTYCETCQFLVGNCPVSSTSG